MNQEDINRLMDINNRYFSSVNEAASQMFHEMNDFISEKRKENAKHYHFKTKKEMDLAMKSDLNPWSTFSFGRKKFCPDKIDK